MEAELAAAPHRVQTRYLLERGRVFNTSGEPDKALVLFREAYDIARQHGQDALAVDAAHMIAIVERNPAERFTWNGRALHIAQHSSSALARAWQGSIHNNIGWDYFDAKDYSNALESFQASSAAFLAQDRRRAHLIARWSEGKALRYLERTEQALAIQSELERHYATTGSTDGFVFEELAELHFARGSSATARGYFAKAYAALKEDPYLRQHEMERLERMYRLSQH